MPPCLKKFLNTFMQHKIVFHINIKEPGPKIVNFLVYSWRNPSIAKTLQNEFTEQNMNNEDLTSLETTFLRDLARGCMKR